MSQEEDNLLQSLDYSVLQQCMHCGMCLPTCPTYDETSRERNSPRGRIALARAVADGRYAVDNNFAAEFDYCVGCLACQSACPAGVDYAQLLETARSEVERQGVRTSMIRSFYSWLAMRVITKRPWLLRVVSRLVYVVQRSWARRILYGTGLIKLAPRRLQELEPLAPRVEPPFSSGRISAIETPAQSQPRYRVGLLTGCVQDVAYAKINRATADVLLANGCEVDTPRSQGCCGSLHAHNGDLESARDLARKMIDTFDLEVLDAIISNAGGCGSHLKHYARLLADDPDYFKRACLWDAKLRDVHEWLVEINFRTPSCGPEVGLVAYDASCHLCHGQGIRSQPLAVLSSIPGVELVSLSESEWCCGSAGIYSITQPETAQRLLDRKLDHLVQTKASVVATGNPGCLLQLANGVRNHSVLYSMQVVHPVELLAAAYAEESAAP